MRGSLESIARELVKQADPRKIPNYATSSELPRGVNWGVLVARFRDSETLSQSNWDCVVRDLEKNFGDEDEENGWVIERDNHWAVGWVEVLYVKYFPNNYDDPELTEIGYWALENVYLALQDYPVYDEDHFSNAESEAAWEQLKWEFTAEQLPIVEQYIFDNQLDPDYGDSWSGDQITKLTEMVEEFEESVERAYKFLDYLDEIQQSED